MLPALQPHRPQLQPSQPVHIHQQTRTVHAPPPPPPPPSVSQTTTHPPSHLFKPRTQLEAMPTFAPNALVTPRNVYDAATRHPVFFTEQLRKPPFPMPAIASQGWNPVASGYILERRRGEGSAVGRTKL